MRNLKLCNLLKLNDSILEGASHLTLDPNLNEIFTVNGKQELIRVVRSPPCCEKLCELSILDVSTDFIVSLEFILEERTISIIFSSGNVMSYDISSGVLDAVAKLAGGIDCVSWSPDQETAVVTCPGNNKLVIIDRFYKVMMEHSLNTAEYGSESLVSVGWGSKETQFHGSLGKGARAKREENQQILPNDDRKCRVSWRGDGQYFAVSSIDESASSRVVRIYDRDFVLQFTSDVKEGLEHMLSWKPSGEFFVVTQQKFNRHQVSFLEKNGLFFTSFDLPFDFGSISVEHITWSCDSKFLSLVVDCVDYKKQSLLIYSYGNGHWYLKQVLDFDIQIDKISAVVWDPINVTLLHILTCSSYRQLTFKWNVSQSPSATVAVIDGKDILITPFEICVIPPPMCAYSFTFRNFVRDVSFALNGDLFVQLVDSTIVKLTLSPCQDETPISEIFTTKIHHTVGPNKAIAHVTSYVSVVKGTFDSDSCHLTAAPDGFIIFNCKDNEPEILHICGKGEKKYPLASGVAAIAENSSTIELEDASVLSFKSLDDQPQDSLNARVDENMNKIIFQQVCPSIATVGKLTFGLSSSYTLYCNNQTVLKNCCTSFAIIDERFLAYTTTSHHLHIISIVRCDWIKSVDDEKCNPVIPIERGALIVSHSINSGSIVLQARRGNLEVLHPRTLLWSLVQSMVSEKKFLPAFEIMRKHRMDFNLIVDNDYNRFMDSLQDFVAQVGGESVDYMVLFISNLSNDVKATPMLHETIDHASQREKKSETNKIASICIETRKIANLIDPVHYLDVILVTHIKCNEYEEALKLIVTLNESQREAAFQFMFYFINVNDLYNHALGTYSDEITLMVAGRSQKDPLEYKKLLADLATIKCESYRRYKIDVLLNRPVKALENLIRCNDVAYREETVMFIVNKRLYKEALDAVEDANLLNEIWTLYGDYLLVKRYYLEAGIAYSKGSNREKSVKAYQLAGNWNLALKECLLLKDGNLLKTLCSTLIHSLSLCGQHVDAAFIAHRYLNDNQVAIRTLINGHAWNHAANMITSLSNNEEEETFFTKLLLDGLLEHSSTLCSVMDSEKNLLKGHCDRLVIVRQEKVKLQQRREEEGDSFDDSMSQISSIRSSSIKSSSATGSSRTLKTKKSSATRETRQLFKLKQGSRTEDIALLLSIKECIGRVEALQTEISDLLIHLTLHAINRTSEVRSKFTSLINCINETIPRVWIENLVETFYIDENTIQIPEDFSLMIAKPKFKEISWDLILLA